MIVSAFTAVDKIQKNLKPQPFLTIGHDKSAVGDAKHKPGC